MYYIVMQISKRCVFVEFFKTNHPKNTK